MKNKVTLPKLNHRRFPLIIRLIALILTVTFLAQDIVWANPDQFISKPAHNNKLAPDSLFKQKDKRTAAERTFIEHLIEKHPLIGSKISLYAIDHILESNDIKGWFTSNNIIYQTYKDEDGDVYEIRITIPHWGILRYFDPKFSSERTEPGTKTSEEINRYLFKERIPMVITARDKPGPAPFPVINIEEMKNADDVANFIEGLNLRHSNKERDNDFLRQVFALFFACLARDFDKSDDFIKMCRSILDIEEPNYVRSRMNDPLIANYFSGMRKKSSIGDVSIGLYGALLYYIVPDPEPYIKHMYSEFMRDNPKDKLSLGSRGTSYYTRGDSVAQIYRKGLLYGDWNNPFFKLFIYQYESLAQTSKKDVDDRTKSKNALKILRAIGLWRDEALKRHDIEMVARIDDFIEQTTVLEVDLKTRLFFSDPDNNVVRLVHVEGRKHALELPEKYLTSLDLDDDVQMRELATWLDLGQRLVDKSETMINAGRNAEAIQGARSGITLSFFDDENAHFVESGYLRDRLAEFMEEETVFKYKSMMMELAELEKEGARLFMTGESNKERTLFAEARNIYKHLLYRYEALGMRSSSNRAYNNMLLATESVRLYDRGAYLPCRCHIDDMFTALRFERWDDFLAGLKAVLSGRGFPIRGIERGEIETLKYLLTPSNESHTGFEDDIKHALYAHLEVVGRDKIGHIIEEAEDLLKDYFGDKEGAGKLSGTGYLDRAFSGLGINEIDYLANIAPIEKPFISGTHREAFYDSPGVINKAAEIVETLRGQWPEPARNSRLAGKKLKEIIKSVRNRFKSVENSLLPQEREVILKALEGLERQNLVECDSVVLHDKKEGAEPRAWLLGFNTAERSPGASSDLFSEELRKRLVIDFPDTILLSREVLGRAEKDYHLLCEYVFALAVSPYAFHSASRYIRTKMFPSNYMQRKYGPYANQNIGELESIFGNLIMTKPGRYEAIYNRIVRAIKRFIFQDNGEVSFRSIKIFIRKIFEVVKWFNKNEDGSFALAGKGAVSQIYAALRGLNKKSDFRTSLDVLRKMIIAVEETRAISKQDISDTAKAIGQLAKNADVASKDVEIAAASRHSITMLIDLAEALRNVQGTKELIGYANRAVISISNQTSYDAFFAVPAIRRYSTNMRSAYDVDFQSTVQKGRNATIAVYAAPHSFPPVLHVGINGWKAPPEELWNDLGAVRNNDATLDIPFRKTGDGGIYKLDLDIPPEGIDSIDFVVKVAGQYLKDKSSDFSIEVKDGTGLFAIFRRLLSRAGTECRRGVGTPFNKDAAFDGGNASLSMFIAGQGLKPDASAAEIDNVIIDAVNDPRANDTLLRILGFRSEQRQALREDKGDLFRGAGKFEAIEDIIGINGIKEKTIERSREKIRISIKCQKDYGHEFAKFAALAYSIKRDDTEDDVESKIEKIFAEYRPRLRDGKFLNAMSDYFANDPRMLLSLAYIVWVEIRAGPEDARKPLIDTLLKLSRINRGWMLAYYKITAIRYLDRLGVKKDVRGILAVLAARPPKDPQFRQAAFRTVVDLAREGTLRPFYAFIKPEKFEALALLAIEAVAEARAGTKELSKFLNTAKAHPSEKVQAAVKEAESQLSVAPDPSPGLFILRNEEAEWIGGLCGKLYKDSQCNEVATDNIEGREENGQLRLFDRMTGMPLYFSNANEAKISINGTTSEGIKILRPNRFMAGFANRQAVYIVKSFINEEIIRYHEERERYYAEEGMPPHTEGISAHTFIRGCGKDIRDAFDSLVERDMLPSDCTAEDLIHCLKRAGLSEERFNDSEFNLIRYNENRLKAKGVELLYGKQDRHFNPVVNRSLKETILCKKLFGIINRRPPKDYEELALWMVRRKRSDEEKRAFPERLKYTEDWPAGFIGESQLSEIGIKLGFLANGAIGDDDSFEYILEANKEATAHRLLEQYGISEELSKKLPPNPTESDIGRWLEDTYLSGESSVENIVGLMRQVGMEEGKKNTGRDITGEINYDIAIQRLRAIDPAKLKPVLEKINENYAYWDIVAYFYDDRGGREIFEELDIKPQASVKMGYPRKKKKSASSVKTVSDSTGKAGQESGAPASMSGTKVKDEKPVESRGNGMGGIGFMPVARREFGIVGILQTILRVFLGPLSMYAVEPNGRKPDESPQEPMLNPTTLGNSRLVRAVRSWSAEEIAYYLKERDEYILASADHVNGDNSVKLLTPAEAATVLIKLSIDEPEYAGKCRAITEEVGGELLDEFNWLRAPKINVITPDAAGVASKESPSTTQQKRQTLWGGLGIDNILGYLRGGWSLNHVADLAMKDIEEGLMTADEFMSALRSLADREESYRKRCDELASIISNRTSSAGSAQPPIFKFSIMEYEDFHSILKMDGSVDMYVCPDYMCRKEAIEEFYDTNKDNHLADACVAKMDGEVVGFLMVDIDDSGYHPGDEEIVIGAYGLDSQLSEEQKKAVIEGLFTDGIGSICKDLKKQHRLRSVPARAVVYVAEHDIETFEVFTKNSPLRLKSSKSYNNYYGTGDGAIELVLEYSGISDSAISSLGKTKSANGSGESSSLTATAIEEKSHPVMPVVSQGAEFTVLNPPLDPREDGKWDQALPEDGRVMVKVNFGSATKAEDVRLIAHYGMSGKAWNDMEGRCVESDGISCCFEVFIPTGAEMYTLRASRDYGKTWSWFTDYGSYINVLTPSMLAEKEARLKEEAKKEVRVHVRWMIRRDMPEVLAIEPEAFEFPWSEEDFIRCLRQRNNVGMVAEHDDKVAGFMIYGLQKKRIHVLNFAVAGDYRRQGVGSQMVAKLIAKLSNQEFSNITLEVRETNISAQLFFRENGFRAVATLHGYYADTSEDAYMMQLKYDPNRKSGGYRHRAGSPASCLESIVKYCGKDMGRDFSAEDLLEAGLRKRKDGKDLDIDMVKWELRRLHHADVLDLVEGSRPYRYVLKSDIRNLSPPQR
ncbi:MAG: ribosomal protein S18-alanine N-acetyltransferase, partial [Candidatus Omnitrophica bacterium]|nr:ribosomal protein S18-alanine N-acetyltransferase [Candidatus Omnitrophota bacterium]